VTKQLDAQTRNLVVFEVSATDKKGELGDAGESFVKSYFEANSDLFQTEETRSGVAYVLSEASMKDKDPTVVQDLLFEIEDAFAGASDFDEVAKQYELQKKEIAKNITQSGVNNEMQSVLFELDQDIVSDAMNDNGTFAFVTVTNITESQPIAFEDARPKIEDIWHDTQKAQSVEKNIVALRTADDPRAFAADNNIDTNTVNNVTRQSAKPYLAPLFKSAALNKLVALDDSDAGQKRLGMVTSIAPIGAIDKIDTATSKVNDQMANQDFEVLLSSWFENAEIDVNENALNLIAQNLKGADTN